jgi:tetraacyldisaccharide 4'-kinase
MKIISELRANLHKTVNRRTLRAWRPAHAPPDSAAAGTAFSEGPPALFRAVSRLYEMGLDADQARKLKKRVKLPVPVVSIGNLSVGGTGKTPLAVWMCKFLIEIGLRPAVLTRGYGRKKGGAGPVPSFGDRAQLAGLFGDEPVMISGYLPEAQVWVGANRSASGMAALARGGVDVFVVDDGFQHLALERDLDLVLLDCRNPFGNGFVLPAGPLREPISNLSRAHAFVITNAGKNHDAAPLKDKLRGLFPEIPVFVCRHVMKAITLADGESPFPIGGLSGRRAFAFAGIAGPEGFFSQLREAGITICESLSFPDHHRYTGGDFSRIFGCASGCGAELIITTAKDAVRIPPPYRDAVITAEIEIDFGADSEGFCGLTAARLGVTGAAKSGTKRGKRPGMRRT